MVICKRTLIQQPTRNNTMEKISMSPLKLKTSDYWRQLHDLQKAGEIPNELFTYLIALISSHVNQTLPPTLSKKNIGHLKKINLQGIELSDSAGDSLLEIMVFVPENQEMHRTFGILVRKYPGFRLLKDL
jgi:hypothetical protein